MAQAALREAFRLLQLPTLFSREAAAIQKFEEHLVALGQLSTDAVDWVKYELNGWSADSPSESLVSLVKAIVSVSEPVYGPRLAQQYFPLHGRLVSKFFLSHVEATALLSHALFAMRLAEEEGFSGAQLARVLASRDGRVTFTRQNMTALLGGLSLNVEFDLLRTQAVYASDLALEPFYFVDANLEESADIVAEKARQLGLSDGIKTALKVLYPTPAANTFTPYIQILNFQAMLVEAFDHDVLDLYEFKPRGQPCIWLCSTYPTNLAGAGNPFLNNAKAVERLTDSWMRSKEGVQQAGARALLQILSSLDGLGVGARKELGLWIRLWILRAIRLAGPPGPGVPSPLTAQNVRSLLMRVAAGNTGTLGILEQRIVDAIGSTVHPQPHWRPRGLGDAVNATNISKRKLGDCDFQNSTDFQIVAYESHGGVLTETYLNEHLRTLAKAIELRKPELEGVADVENWQATIHFIAHQVTAQAVLPFDVHGLQISVELHTFNSFIGQRAVDQVLIDAFTDNVAEHLNARRTPEAVRVQTCTFL